MKRQADSKNLLLGVTGSIASYKSPHLVRLLQKAGWQVKVILTQGGASFVTPLTLATLTGNQVYTKDSPQDESQPALLHIDLARWADLILIAPASANTMARLAQGQANDLLSCVVLASEAPVFLAPSLNEHMWAHPATQGNFQTLSRRGVRFLGPEAGEQACGDQGFGRLREPEDLVSDLDVWRREKGTLTGLKILVSAGGTQEPIDPVRFIGNRSSGKMGYAFARRAQEMGAQVTLVSAPTALRVPAGVVIERVRTASDMREAVLRLALHCDIFISVAAVCDWRVAQLSPQKIKHKEGDLTLTLAVNADILKEVASLPSPPFLVGFSAETENVLKNARAKCQKKGTQIMIANDVSSQETGFDSEQNAVWLITDKGEEFFPPQEKTTLAHALLLKIKESFHERAR